MIDLHMHTKYSDGTDNIIEFLQKAEKNNLEIISITDHNNVKAYYELEKLNVKDYFHGKIITGIELNTKILNIPIEVLGYNIDYKLMDSLLPSFYLSPKERNKIELNRLYKKCLTAGLKISEDDFSTYDYSDFASKFIHTLITKDEYNKQFIDEEAWDNSSAFYRKYMSNPNTPLYVEMDDIIPDFKTVSDLIKNCGGFIFIPHIFEYRDNADKILNFILNNYEIDGIECYYTTFSSEQTQKLLQICKNRFLYISGGSDYHGGNKPNINMAKGLGNLNIPLDITYTWLK